VGLSGAEALPDPMETGNDYLSDFIEKVLWRCDSLTADLVLSGFPRKVAGAQRS
jgi:hypothetical protein